MLDQERPEDLWAVEALLDTCFAPGRELLSSYRLRDGVPPVADLCLVSRVGGAVDGVIRCWPVRAGGVPALLLGPIAVHPTRQGEGLGAILVRETLSRAARLGHARAMLVGDAAYYARFGFTRLGAIEMPPPTNPARVLGLSLVPGAWSGIAGVVTSWQTAQKGPS